MSKDKFEQAFKDKFNDFNRDTTEEMKFEVLSNLPQKKKSAFGWKWAAAAMLAGLTVSAYMLYRTNEATHVIVEQKSDELLVREPEDAISQEIETENIPLKNTHTQLHSARKEKVSPLHTENSVAQTSESKVNEELVQMENEFFEQKRVQNKGVVADNSVIDRMELFIPFNAEEQKEMSEFMDLAANGSQESKNELIFKADSEDEMEIVQRKKLSPLFAILGTEAFMGYNHIDVNTNDEILIVDVENAPAVSLDRVGFRAHVGLGLQINRRLALILLASGQMAQYNVAYGEQTGTFDSLSITEQSDRFRVDVHRTAIPQEIDIRQLSFGLKSGLVYQYMDRGALRSAVEVSMSYLTSVSDDLDYLRTNQLYLNVGHRFEYAMNDRINLLLNPLLAYSLLNNRGNYQLSLNPYSLGLGFGVEYRFLARGS
jgi:hypothetical protein